MPPLTTSVAETEVIDLLKLVTTICQLMTLYTLRPCEQLATNINRYLKLTLNSSQNKSSSEWQNLFQDLLSQWESISKQHAQDQLAAIKMELNKSMSDKITMYSLK